MTYAEYKRAFIKAHERADWTVDTSSMDSDGKYTKTYIFSDGAILYEVNRPVWRTATAKAVVEGIEIELKQDIKLFETEAWNTDNANSVKFYEKW